MSPGPISDSYDPEFGTGENASDVREAVEKVRDRMTKRLGPALSNIVAVVQGKPGRVKPVNLSDRDCRVIRFALNRALESL